MALEKGGRCNVVGSSQLKQIETVFSIRQKSIFKNLSMYAYKQISVIRQFARNKVNENSQITETLKNGGTNDNCCDKKLSETTSHHNPWVVDR